MTREPSPDPSEGARARLGSTSPRAPSPLRRVCFAAAAVLLWALTYFTGQVLPQPGIAAHLLDRLLTILQVLLFFLAASGVGLRALSALRLQCSSRLGQLVTSIGLGLGAFSLLNFFLGSLGWLSSGSAFAYPAVALALNASPVLELLRRRNDGSEAVGEGSRNGNAVKVICLVIIALVLMLHLLRAFTPPLEYDVLEYHLGAPSRYFHQGRIFFLRDNVYANFPQNVEMLYLGAMMLKADVLKGIFLSQVINVFLGLTAAGAVYSLTRRFLSREAAVPAAALFYSAPWISHVSLLAYVTCGLCLYVFLTLHCFFAYDRSTGGERRRWLVLGGIFAGLALGVKYPAALFLILPLAIFALVLQQRRARCFHRAVRAPALFVFVSLALVSPWLIRNAVNTGNPVYPLLHRVFGAKADTWDARREARFMQHHRPSDYSVSATGRSLWQFFIVEPKGAHQRIPVLLVLFIPLLIIAKPLPRAAVFLCLYAAIAVIFWLFFTHRIGRFLLPWLAAVVAVNAYALLLASRRGLFLLGKVALVAAVFLGFAHIGLANIAGLERVGELFLGLATPREVILSLTRPSEEPHGPRHVPRYSGRMIERVNALAGPDQRALFIGEAEVLYAGPDVITSTVFDRSPLERLLSRCRTADELAEELRRLRIRYIYVNLMELSRLRTTYRYTFEGRRVPGLLDLPVEKLAILQSFFLRHTRIIDRDFRFRTPLSIQSTSGRRRDEHLLARDLELYQALAPGVQLGIDPSGRKTIYATEQFFIYALKSEPAGAEKRGAAGHSQDR